ISDAMGPNRTSAAIAASARVAQKQSRTIYSAPSSSKTALTRSCNNAVCRIRNASSTSLQPRQAAWSNLLVLRRKATQLTRPSAESMPEMSRTREHHGDAVIVGGLDHLLIAHRT